MWDTCTRKQLWQVQAHNGHIWAITPDSCGQTFYTVGHDKAIKRWSYKTIAEACDQYDVHKGPSMGNKTLTEPMDTWLCNVSVANCDACEDFGGDYETGCTKRLLCFSLED